MSNQSPSQPLRLYQHALSGHCHRVQCFLSILRLPFELVDVDLRAGAHKQPDFLRKNPFGQVPVLEDREVRIADSAASLVYLATRYDSSRSWFPTEPRAQAEVTRWLSVAAGPLVQGPGAARRHAVFGGPVDLARAQTISQGLFEVLESHLAQQRFLAGAAPTLADLTLYAYTAHAPEGGVSMEPYPNIRAWIARVQSLPGFVPMQATKTAIHA